MGLSPPEDAASGRRPQALRALVAGSPYDLFAALGEGRAAVAGDFGGQRWCLEAASSPEALQAALARRAADLLVVLGGSSRLPPDEAVAAARAASAGTRCVLLAGHPLDATGTAGLDLALVAYGRRTALASLLCLAGDRWWGDPAAPALLLVEDDPGWASVALEVLQCHARSLPGPQRVRTLWARDCEEALAELEALGDRLLLAVSDGEYPCGGRPERLVGVRFLGEARRRRPGLAALLVSADEAAAAAAAAAGLAFVGKAMDAPVDLLRAAVARALPAPKRLARTLQRSQVRSPSHGVAAAAAWAWGRRPRRAEPVLTGVGPGSLGGKGRSIEVLGRLVASLAPPFEGVRLAVPPTLAIRSEVCERFLEDNGLLGLIACASALSDAEIVQAFRRAEVGRAVRLRLGEWLARTPGPVAVRSSASLEDCRRHPLAGAFATVLVGEEGDAGERLERVLAAVAVGWASAFTADARRLMSAAGIRHRPAMAVLVQALVGSRHGRYFYPTFSGLASSFNYYPFRDMQPTDGVAVVAMGLGKALDDGREGLRFCPRCPHVVPQHGSVRDTLAGAQRRLWALDLEARDELLWPGDPGLVELEAARELRQGIGALIASTYVPANDSLVDGIRDGGAPVITFQRLLRGRQLPLGPLLDWLLRTLEAAMHGPVEIEFAMDLERHEDPATLWLLQCRPLAAGGEPRPLSGPGSAGGREIVRSCAALGHGSVRDIRDVVVVLADLDRARTVEVAGALERVDRALRQAGRPYLLVGPGRWGSRDQWLGIPVAWAQVSGARAIVETDFADLVGEPSQGSHFFHHLTAAGIPFLGVHRGDGGRIDWEWLCTRPPAVTACEGKVRHLRLEEPLEVRVDGRRREGVVLAACPPQRVAGHGEQPAACESRPEDGRPGGSRNRES